ncbi:hypothetical protein Clacol_008986 [Clathrus columnatus]|uniref:Uncharacterized protein n=1 Tax=Clathrus columnatus TaxID=1419009 RepID=A0AAV5ANI9_9AGAM|nr:hypothetical protein Clacol_008986 [Clathrus columnatus]
MSLLSGIISGSLVAGGLQEPEVPAPPPASVRIHRNPRKEFLIQRWNDEIAGLFRSVLRMDRQISEFGRKIIGDTDK